MTTPTITLLAASLRSNLMSRAYILAKLLEPEFRVHIVGPGSHDEVWAPIRSDPTLDIRPFQVTSAFDLRRGRRSIVKKYIEGDLIYAMKPVNTSFGLGLTARRILDRPLLLDIEEWELGLISESIYWEARLMKWQWLQDPGSPLYTRMLERRVHEADAITVSNAFLHKRYGGMWLPHARDPEQFTPQGIVIPPNHQDPTVLTCGSIRNHKGFDLLLNAWNQIKHPTASLRIVGVPDDHPIVAERRWGDRVSIEPPIPLSEVPSVLNDATIVVVPQRSSRASRGQLPTRLIDAMAAGRTIVSTQVNDIPMWLCNGAGIVVEPDSIEALAAGIQQALDDPVESLQMARMAHERFLDHASFEAVRPRVFRLVHHLLNGAHPASLPQSPPCMPASNTGWIVPPRGYLANKTPSQNHQT